MLPGELLRPGFVAARPAETEGLIETVDLSPGDADGPREKAGPSPDDE